MTSVDLGVLDGVTWQGTPVPGERCHALLAALVEVFPRALPVAGLIEEVWPEERPAHPEKALQVLVSRTRSRTSPEAVRHEGGRYRLGVDADAVVLSRLVDEALGETDSAVVRDLAGAALEVPVASIGDDIPDALARVRARARQDQLRVEAALGAALLELGDPDLALPLLLGASQRRPHDEPLLAQLLRAEAASSGVPAALARYADYREAALDRSGAGPGPELQRLHAELLARETPVREGLEFDATPMIGRDDDVVALRTLLSRHRVVSIVGPGGLGKTRMAHLVGRLADQPVVHFIELAGVTTGEGVLPEVASALGVRDSLIDLRATQRRADLRSRTAQQLATPTLLVLDNCEHVVQAVADLVAFLVASGDETRVLTTSRAPLGVAGEQVYLLPQLEESDAVELFEQRAQASRRDVRLDRSEVAGLVDRLDGLPLAIELAAAKVRVMSVPEIARRLADRFALLRGGNRTAPERHQTLEAVIDWSWNLLHPDEQAAMRALSAFPDGFSLAGAEALVGRDPIPVLGQLVDQSLLTVREGSAPGDGIRYRLLETVREYGAARLEQHGETAEVAARLRHWAVEQARGLDADLYSPQQVATMVKVRQEAGNLAGVMRTAVSAGEAVEVLPLISLLGNFWTVEGDHLTVLALARGVLEELATADLPEEHWVEAASVFAVLSINVLIFMQQIPDSVLDRVGRLVDHGVLDGLTTRARGSVRMLLGVSQMIGNAPEALEAMTSDPDTEVAAAALQWVSQLRENSGDLAGARSAAERALVLMREDEGPWSKALLRSQLAGLAAQAGAWEECVHHALPALEVMRQLGALEDSVQLRTLLVLADLGRGRIEEAESALTEMAAEELSSDTIGWAMAGTSGLAELRLMRGDIEGGLRQYRTHLELARARSLPGLDFPQDFSPWVGFAEGSTVFAHALHGRPDQVADVVTALGVKLPEILAGDVLAVDFPVLGCQLVAFGCWHVVSGTGAPEVGVRLAALAPRCGYSQILPSMAWSNVVSVCDAVAPGLAERAAEAASGLSVDELCRQIIDLLAQLP